MFFCDKLGLSHELTLIFGSDSLAINNANFQIVKFQAVLVSEKIIFLEYLTQGVFLAKRFLFPNLEKWP